MIIPIETRNLIGEGCRYRSRKGVSTMAEEINIAKKRIAADLCSCVNQDNTSLHLEFTIPGVEKENITLRLLDDSFSLSAPRDDVEFVSTGAFCCPVNAKDSEAVYENGLLKIDVPFKDPWQGAYDVPIH